MRILFIGGGNMASALIGGMLQQGYTAEQLRVVDVVAEARERLESRYGIRAAAAVDTPVPEDVVVLAVKPQQMRDVARALQPHLRGQLVLSIAAGIRTGDLARWLGNGRIVQMLAGPRFDDDGPTPSPEPSMSALVGAVLIVIGCLAKRKATRRTGAGCGRTGRSRLTWQAR